MCQCVSPSISQFYNQTEANGLEGAEKFTENTNECIERRQLTNNVLVLHGLAL